MYSRIDVFQLEMKIKWQKYWNKNNYGFFKSLLTLLSSLPRVRQLGKISLSGCCVGYSYHWRRRYRCGILESKLFSITLPKLPCCFSSPYVSRLFPCSEVCADYDTVWLLVPMIQARECHRGTCILDSDHRRLLWTEQWPIVLEQGITKIINQIRHCKTVKNDCKQTKGTVYVAETTNSRWEIRVLRLSDIRMLRDWFTPFWTNFLRINTFRWRDNCNYTF